MENPFEIIDKRLSRIESLLIDLKHNSTISSPLAQTEEILTVKEAAIFLKLSVPTIYTLISKGELPVMKRSQRCYFFKEELIGYLKKGHKKSRSEIKVEAETYIKNHSK